MHRSDRRTKRRCSRASSCHRRRATRGEPRTGRSRRTKSATVATPENTPKLKATKGGRKPAIGEVMPDDGAECYIPLRSLADPPPRSAREVLSLGESRTFVVASVDATRRGIDLALPGAPLPDPAPEVTDQEPVALP